MDKRLQSYEAKSETKAIWDLSEKLGKDLRRLVQELGFYPVLSSSWCDMARSLSRIASVTEMVRAANL